MVDKKALVAYARPSSFDRLAACPASLRETQQWEESHPPADNQFLQEGRIAHRIAELVLTNKRSASDSLPSLVGRPLLMVNGDVVVNDKGVMFDDGAIDSILRYCQAVNNVVDILAEDAGIAREDVEVEIEKRLKIGVTGRTGIADAIIRNGKESVILDYKHGIGVSANPLYAGYLYCIAEMQNNHKVDKVSFGIVQPRLFQGDRAKKVLVLTRDVLHQAMKKVSSALGEALKENPEYRSGAHCAELFCPAISTCPLMHTKTKEIANSDLQDDQILLETLRHQKAIERKLKDSKTILRVRAESDTLPDGIGYRQVSGRKYWKEDIDDELMQICSENNVNPFKNELKTVSQVTKELGKDKADEIEELTVKKGGYLTFFEGQTKPQHKLAKSDIQSVTETLDAEMAKLK